MNAITAILFGPDRGVNVLSLDWDHLIVLDACRCDIFERVYRKFFSTATVFKCIISPASSTMEFVRKNLDDNIEKKLKDVVFVNSNPMIDHVLGARLKKLFYKYIPVWRKHWDSEIGTVRPEDTYYVALKTYVRNPGKRMFIWFLQPHYPYVDKRFNHINALGREFMNRALHHDTSSNNLSILIKIVKNLLRNGYLCAGIPDKICEYAHQTPSEIIKAYIVNLLSVLYYVRKLVEILPGKIVVTSDHGESFGEPLNKLASLPVYGHPSRIKISSLIQIPYLEVKNSIQYQEAIRKALKLLLTRLKDTNTFYKTGRSNVSVRQ